MKKICSIFILIMATLTAYTQKQSLGAVSFTVPKGWQQKQVEGGMQLSVTDNTTGGYAMIIITKATASTASASENFTTYWDKLVKSTVQVNGKPILLDPAKQNEWDVISGGANYTDGANTGMATLISATGGAQTISVVLMTNTKKYLDKLTAFSNSLKWANAVQNVTGNTTPPATTGGTGRSSIVGLWTDYILETTGYAINGIPQYTAGYLRKEYNFYANGTYLFRNKQWLVKAPTIVFVYETGTYTVNGNQLIITPNKSKGGFWNKTGSTKEWGSFIKSSDYKPEKTVYNFEIKNDPTYGTSIILRSTNPTQRDGGKFNAANDPYEFRYSSRKLESLIDNPPGF